MEQVHIRTPFRSYSLRITCCLPQIILNEIYAWSTVASITCTVAFLVHSGHFSIPSITSGQTQVNTFDVGNNI